MLSIFLAFIIGVQISQPPSFKRYDTVSGLSNNTVHDVYQDSDGFIWIATENGLNKFDGYEFEIFRHNEADSTSISHSIVKTIAEDRNGYLWVGVANGFNRFDPKTKTFERFLHFPGYERVSYEVQSIAIDKEGKFWFPLLNAIGMFDPETESFSIIEAGDRVETELPAISGLYRIYIDIEGDVWVYSEEARVIGKVNETHDGFTNYSVSDMQQFFYSSNTRILSYSDTSNIIPFNGRRVISALPRELVPQKHIERESGALWVGSNQGIHIYDSINHVYEHVMLDPFTGVLSNFAQDLFQDKWSGVWVGTRNGLYHYDPWLKPFTHINLPDFDNGSSVVMSFEETDTGVWVGTLGGGLSLYDTRAKRFSEPPVLFDQANAAAAEVWDVFKHSEQDDIIWAATSNGLYSYHEQTKEATAIELPHNSNVGSIVFSVEEADSSSIWVVADEDIYKVDIYNGAIEKRIHFDESRRTTALQVVRIYNDSILLIGSQGGSLFAYDLYIDGFIEVPDSHLIRPDYNVWDIYIDSDNISWIASSNGLFRLDMEQKIMIQFQESTNNAQSIMFNILDDQEGKLWIGSDRGMIAFDKEKASFQYYRTQSGLVNDEFNRRAAIQSEDGMFWFGGTHGITRFSPSEVKNNPNIPPVHISSITILNKEGRKRAIPDAQNNINLSWIDDAFEIEYIGLNYTNSGNNQYRYQLENLDPDWVEAGSRRFVRYPKVPPGEYRFKVQASNNDGVWNTQGASLAINIHPPFWKTWWAYSMYMLLVLGGFVGFIKYRTRYLELERQKLERMVSKRTVELNQQKEVALEAKKQIELQAEQLKELDEVKSRFFANISHELRTPLTLIQAPIQELIGSWKEIDSVETIDTKLQLIERNSERLRKLIEELLDLSRLKQNTLEVENAILNLSQWIRLFLKPYHSLAASKGLYYKIEDEIPDELCINIDAGKLEKIVSNLITNALKFTPEGGAITITITHIDTSIKVSVIDNGVGIPEEEQKKIFDRFYQSEHTSEKADEGLGLGLALSKELAKAMDGSLEVRSEKGKGSTFSLELPAEVIEQESEDVSIAIELSNNKSTDEGQHPAHSVLIVEDNDEMRGYIAGLLANDFEVIQAENGKKALLKLNQHAPDLILSDVMMPEMDGFELAGELRAKQDSQQLHIPILMLTARASDEDRMKGFRIGVDDYLIKPFVPEELKARAINLAKNHRNRMNWLKDIRDEEPEVLIPQNSELAEIQEIIEGHLQNADLSIQSIANELRTSERQVYRKIQALTGMTPSEYINSFRLDKARHLLRTAKHLTIDAIAVEAGFKSRSYFSKLFKQSYGVPPSKYVRD